MTMIESVAVRQRGGFDFETHYDNLCALQSSCPLPAVKAHLAEGVLDLNGDRIRATDWNPILKTIRINRTLTLMAFRSYYQQTLEDQERAGYPIKKKTPAIRCKEITYRLCRALKECLQVTASLKCLELQGIPLRERDLTALSKGIMKNNTLEHLSLEHTRIGDDGLEVLCRGVKNSQSITSFNLTGCSLTWQGADHIAKIIKHQATKRHNEAWQDSLRYRRPDLDRMSGIRRITVNTNPLLGDTGATLLAEALKDDLWLKALDLQQCGLTETGAKALLDVLKYNTTIVVLDVRQNPMIEQEMLHNIMEQVMINCNGQDTEYKWVKAEPLQDPLKPKVRKKRTKTLQNSFGKRTVIKSSQRRRSRSTGNTVSHDQVKPGSGMPWRTAQRANRYRCYPPDGSTESMTDLSPAEGVNITIDYSSGDEDSEKVRQLKIELEHLRRRFREEKASRAAAEERMIELTMENKRLRSQLEQYISRRSILDDDRVLESIEASFKQFHAFLDLVRDAGLGQLITLAGIDQSELSIAMTSRQRNSVGGRLSGSYIKSQKDDDVDVSLGSACNDAADVSCSVADQGSAFVPTDTHLFTPISSANRNASVVSSDADVSLPAPRHVTAPTTPLIATSTKPKSKFDELYQKVLRETEANAETKVAPPGDVDSNRTSREAGGKAVREGHGSEVTDNVATGNNDQHRDQVHSD